MPNWKCIGPMFYSRKPHCHVVLPRFLPCHNVQPNLSFLCIIGFFVNLWLDVVQYFPKSSHWELLYLSEMYMNSLKHVYSSLKCRDFLFKIHSHPSPFHMCINTSKSTFHVLRVVKESLFVEYDVTILKHKI